MTKERNKKWSGENSSSMMLKHFRQCYFLIGNASEGICNHALYARWLYTFACFILKKCVLFFWDNIRVSSTKHPSQKKTMDWIYWDLYLPQRRVTISRCDLNNNWRDSRPTFCLFLTNAQSISKRRNVFSNTNAGASDFFFILLPGR